MQALLGVQKENKKAMFDAGSHPFTTIICKVMRPKMSRSAVRRVFVSYDSVKFMTLQYSSLQIFG
jgi:hypothetical protein